MECQRRKTRNKIWKEYDPFAGFPIDTAKIDAQGWQSQHRFLADSVQKLRPTIIVEVGVWKGGSAIEMAKALKEHQIDGAVIAVDTWLGAWDHWLDPLWHKDLGFEFGYPTLFKVFIANVISNNLQDYIIPMPLDSANAAAVIEKNGLNPDVVHIDAAHDYSSAWRDITTWWELLRPGGVILIDDFNIEGHCWPGVFQAVNEFRSRFEIENFESEGLKCRFSKPSLLKVG
jgi:predicted O-methyltransferase YrrM